MQELPYSQACENNKGPILNILEREFANSHNVLEIGSGTGQHAVHFAKGLPHLKWQCADQSHYHEGIQLWIADSAVTNVMPPIELKFPELGFPTHNPVNSELFDAFFTANTAHIMQKEAVEFMMDKVNACLPKHGVFCQYGPFIENGTFNSQSNEEFHHRLLSEGYGGYRSLDELKQWAPDLVLQERIDMPANNLMLIWRKK